MDDNRSLDLSEILSRIHKQAVLVGGPHDGKRAPLPPMIHPGEHPEYLCQPGRPSDTTYYHYRLVGDTTYVYVDHCDTMPGWPHRPDQIEPEQERSRSGQLMVALCAVVVCATSALIMWMALKPLISFILS